MRSHRRCDNLIPGAADIPTATVQGSPVRDRRHGESARRRAATRTAATSGEFPTLTCRYAGGTLLHFVENWDVVKQAYGAVPADARLAGLFGGVFVGERGWVTTMTTGGPIEGGPDAIFEAMKLPTRDVNPGVNDHHANWLECIRTRKKPSCDEEIGHRTASLGHLTNIAFWTGQSLKWDPAKEEFLDHAAANRLRSRATRAPWRL